MPVKPISRWMSFTGAAALLFALSACGASEESEPVSQNDSTDTANTDDESQRHLATVTTRPSPIR